MKLNWEEAIDIAKICEKDENFKTIASVFGDSKEFYKNLENYKNWNECFNII
jgi:hypothetical protein